MKRLSLFLSLVAVIALLIIASPAVRAQTTVSSIQCRDCIRNGDTSPSCANITFNEKDLTPVPGRPNRWMSVSCGTATSDKCAQFLMSTEGQTCSTFYSTASFKCGGCNKWGSHYFLMTCPSDISSGVNAQWQICDDSKCSVNCVAGDHVYNIGTCAPLYSSSSKAHVHIYGMLQNIAPCTTVGVAVYNSSNPQTGYDLVESEVIAQEQCSSLGQMVCSNQPTLPVVNGPNVLVSDYSNHGTCSGSVQYTSVPSGSCRWRSATLSEDVTCGQTAGTCANLLGFVTLHHSGQKRHNAFSPACNVCQRLPHFGAHGNSRPFTLVSCDANTQAVTFTHGCSDNTCSNCNGTKDTYPYDQKTATPYHGMSLINLGTFKCNVVRRRAYFSSNCDASTLIEDLYLGENMCSWGHLATCGNFQVQEATIGGCILNKPETKLAVTSSQCTVDKSSNFFFNNSAVAIRATCSSKQQRCGVIHFWNHNQTRSSLITQRTFVCDTCYIDHRWNADVQTGPFFVSCPNGTAITLTPSNSASDFTCQNLNTAAATTYSLFQPQKMNTNLGYNYNASLAPTLMTAAITFCNSVRLDMANVTASAGSLPDGPVSCSSAPLNPWGNNGGVLFCGSIGEAGCDVSCTSPPVPTANPEQDYDVLVHMCSHPRHFGSSSSASQPHHGWVCDTHRHPTGSCAPFPLEHATNPWSLKITCGNQALCANILIFNDSANTNNCAYYTASGSTGGQRHHSHWNSVCGQCSFSPYHGWSYLSCDYSSNNLTLYQNCSANCVNWRSQCKSRMNIGWQECAHNGNGWSFRSLGVYQCNVVNAQYFNNSQCSGTPTWNIQTQEGTRSSIGGAEFSCVPRDTAFSLPGGQVTYSTCKWDDSTSSSSSTTTKTLVTKSNITQASCVQGLNGDSSTSSMITCHAARIDQCVTLSIYKSATCAQKWDSILNVPCNSCFRFSDGSYAMAHCASSSARNHANNNNGRFGPHTIDGINSISLLTQCDMGCANCQGSVSSEVLGQCAAWGSNTQYYASFSQVSQCATAVYQEWQNGNTACSGYPDFTTYVAQGVCSSGVGLIQCDTVPSPLPKPSGTNGVGVQIKECSSGACTGVCSAHTVKSGACISLAESIAGGNSARFTCDGSVNQCAHMMFWHGEKWLGKLSQVCGSCTEVPKGALGSVTADSARSFLKVECFPNNTVQRSFGCDSTCGVCDTVISSTPVYTRISIPGGSSVLNLGIFPCNTMKREVFYNDSCQGEPIISGPIAEDVCNNGATLSCGTHYGDFETVSRTNCSNAQQPAQTFVSGQCAALPSSSSSAAASTSSDVGVKISCIHGTSTCVNFAASSSSNLNSCKREHLYSAKCGSCFTSGAGVPLRLTCDYDKMTMTLNRCRDLLCQDCENSLGQQTYQAGQCTLSSQSGGKIPLSGTWLGFTQCSVARQQYFYGSAQSNTTCPLNDMVSEVYSAQGTCNGDTRVQCGSYVEGVTAGLIGTNGHPTTFDLMSCGDHHCSDKCTKSFSVPTGTCTPTPSYPSKYTAYQPAGSSYSIFTCPVASACAHIQVFDRRNTAYVNDSCAATANYEPMGFDVACNTCHWTAWGGMIRVSCDLVKETLTIAHGCDATCSNCNFTAGVVHRGMNNCTRAAHHSVDIINTGTYVCSVIQTRGYTDSSCTSLAHTVAFPASHCQFGSIASCSSLYTSPNNNNGAGDNNNGGGSNVGGIIAGVIIGVVALVAGGYFFIRYRNSKRSSSSSSSSYHEEPMHDQYSAFMEGSQPEGV